MSDPHLRDLESPASGPASTAGRPDRSHAHSHGASSDADGRHLGLALTLLLGLMIAEVAAAIASGSLALLADAGHLLTDVAALTTALVAARLATRPERGQWTYGLKRAEILSAAVNGLTLVVIGTLIGVEGVRRLVEPPPVAGELVLWVAVAGVLVNLAATWALAKADRSSLNVRGAYLHILTDLYAFIGTAVAGVVIIVTGWVRADALASLLVAGLMLHAAWGLLRDSGRILLQAAPSHVALDEVRSHLSECTQVVAVHDLHAWTVTSGLPTLTAHVVVRQECFLDGEAAMVLDNLQRCLAGHFDVAHSTFQLEPEGHRDHEPAAHH